MLLLYTFSLDDVFDWCWIRMRSSQINPPRFHLQAHGGSDSFYQVSMHINRCQIYTIQGCYERVRGLGLCCETVWKYRSKGQCLKVILKFAVKITFCYIWQCRKGPVISIHSYSSTGDTLSTSTANVMEIFPLEFERSRVIIWNH